MAVQIIGAQGALTSWTGTFYTALLSKMNAMAATVTAAGDVIDVTALGDYGRVIIPGLGQWTAQLEGFAKIGSVPALGNTGLVAYSGSTNVYIDSYTININAAVHETTAFNGTAPTWKTFRPGVVNWSGTMNARLDDAAASPLPLAVGGSPVSATFTYGTTATLAGNIVITSVAPAIRVGGISLVPITFNGTSTLTPAGANSILGTTAFGGSAATGIPEWNDNGSSAKPLTITTNSGNTLVGADGFWSSLSINVGVSQAVMVSVGVQGSGSMTAT